MEINKTLYTKYGDVDAIFGLKNRCEWVGFIDAHIVNDHIFFTLFYGKTISEAERGLVLKYETLCEKYNNEKYNQHQGKVDIKIIKNLLSNNILTLIKN